MIKNEEIKTAWPKSNSAPPPVQSTRKTKKETQEEKEEENQKRENNFALFNVPESKQNILNERENLFPFLFISSVWKG